MRLGVYWLIINAVCKIKYYNNCLFYDVQQDFIVQTGDPTNTGKAGESIYGYAQRAGEEIDDQDRPKGRGGE